MEAPGCQAAAASASGTAAAEVAAVLLAGGGVEAPGDRNKNCKHHNRSPPADGTAGHVGQEQ